MAELVIAEFEVDRLSAPALNILKAAVFHAEKNRTIRLQTMSIKAFCGLAGIRSQSVTEFSSLLREASCALGTIEVIDTVFPERDDMPYTAWPVFSEVGVAGLNVFYAICDLTFDERLLTKLHSLGNSERAGK